MTDRNKFRQGSALNVQERLNRVYDSIEFTLATGLSDYDVAANESEAFVNLKAYTTINVRSNKEITIKLNSDSYPSITVEANKPFELDNLIEITNVYISNASGDTASIKIVALQKGD
jgi:hypothetical protein